MEAKNNSEKYLNYMIEAINTIQAKATMLKYKPLESIDNIEKSIANYRKWEKKYIELQKELSK